MSNLAALLSKMLSEVENKPRSPSKVKQKKTPSTKKPPPEPKWFTESVSTGEIAPLRSIYVSKHWHNECIVLVAVSQTCSNCGTEFASCNPYPLLRRTHPAAGIDETAIAPHSSLYSHLPRHIEHRHEALRSCSMCFLTNSTDREQLSLLPPHNAGLLISHTGEVLEMTGDCTSRDLPPIDDNLKLTTIRKPKPCKALIPLQQEYLS